MSCWPSTPCFPKRRAVAVLVVAVLLVGCNPRETLSKPPPQIIPAESQLTAVWANNGEDKVTQEELRVSRDRNDTRNSVWNGQRIAITAARNETTAFNLVLEASEESAPQIEVRMSALQHSSGATIGSREADRDRLFDYRGRNVELFFVRYLPIRGLSKIAYETYDERHIPARLRRPFRGEGAASGNWEDRPDHDRHYPDIAVPLELHSPFEVAAGTNQSVWFDVYVPSDAAAGTYHAEIEIVEKEVPTWRIPVELNVHGFRLPDFPSAKTIVFVSRENINQRYLNDRYPYDTGNAALARASEAILDRHYQMAHRHKLSLIENHRDLAQMNQAATNRLDGRLFTEARGYEGIGSGVGNNVFSIGTYGGWPWKNSDRSTMWQETDRWAAWFKRQSFKTPTEYFLYLSDESPDYAQTQQWAAWVKENPRLGSTVPTMATLPAPNALTQTPALSIVASHFHVGPPNDWEQAARQIGEDSGRRLYMYNGTRPASGTFMIEDDGIALRQIAWAQYKLKIDRWFAWESTYYNNYQGGQGETNVFQRSQTFGGDPKRDPVLGVTAWNYGNGDGVLFYPGTDRVFPKESYQIAGPIASLRLKHWRRGVQDVDYLTLAAKVDPQRVAAIVRRIVPKTLWEIGVSDSDDPTWVHTDISWSTDPNTWEAARAELAEIILAGKEQAP